ncbi:hypothetical protein [Agromyces sp. Leaf222]|uniref:hypothetical protein n=1 Tax=Agromyces sp. Leaf222 TaxID=1735688 RepID=UPI00070047D4|nr:hypothetical protein [Agromyces sp. Leaf222]KQM83068.1 hypothetical protein ASE68_07270 [Agromyces sp. Leaf222]
MGETSLWNRIATLALALIIGAIYGTLGTVGHRQTWQIGDVSLPWGLVVALIGVAALLVAFRTIGGGRLVAAVAGLGVILVVGLLTLPGRGGSVLVVGDLTGTIWSIGPALVTVFVVAWPRLPARAARRPGGSEGNQPWSTDDDGRAASTGLGAA